MNKTKLSIKKRHDTHKIQKEEHIDITVNDNVLLVGLSGGFMDISHSIK
jgi:hypothetical protein